MNAEEKILQRIVNQYKKTLKAMLSIPQEHIDIFTTYMAIEKQTFALRDKKIFSPEQEEATRQAEIKYGDKRCKQGVKHYCRLS